MQILTRQARVKNEETMNIKIGKLCFRCLSGILCAKDCKNGMKCSECNRTSHLLALHKEIKLKNKEEKDGEELVNSRCTFLCRGKAGGHLLRVGSLQFTLTAQHPCTHSNKECKSKH